MKLSRLNQEMRAFFADLYEGESKPLVLGEGSENARLALVGEAPGEQEALKGKPFVVFTPAIGQAPAPQEAPAEEGQPPWEP